MFSFWQDSPPEMWSANLFIVANIPASSPQLHCLLVNVVVRLWRALYGNKYHQYKRQGSPGRPLTYSFGGSSLFKPKIFISNTYNSILWKHNILKTAQLLNLAPFCDFKAFLWECSFLKAFLTYFLKVFLNLYRYLFKRFQ